MTFLNVLLPAVLAAAALAAADPAPPVFTDIAKPAGITFRHSYGDIDLLAVNLNDDAKLLRNDGGSRQPWLMIDARLKFPTGSRAAVGARVTVTTGALTQIDDVNPVRGYLSQSDPRLHFGLAGADHATVEIRWPDGKVERLEAVKANQILTREHPAVAQVAR